MLYAQRRKQLHQMLGDSDGVICFLSSHYQSRNYADNVFMPFRQSSHFLYYVGVTETAFAMLSYPDGRDVLFGPPFDIDVVVWTGEQRSLESWGEHAEATECRPISEFADALKSAEPLRYLPFFQSNAMLRFASDLLQTPDQVEEGVSTDLLKAVVAQRLIKTDHEIAEIEKALSLTRDIFHQVMALPLTESTEAEALGCMLQQVARKQWDFSFPPIVTTHGEVLHSHHYSTAPIESGRLLLMDMGIEAPSGYASDITRTFPVDGVFSTQQQQVYDVALQAQLDAIAAVKPGVSFKDVHLLAAETIARGLGEIGLMKGDAKEAVAAGAHALFFPHGLGHMLGLDAHDMEDLGDEVGYGGEGLRSSQFGLGFLRMGRELEPRHVITIEPGIYFIPTLIDVWKSEKKHEEFINYEALDAYRDFGGIRIEDDVLVTDEGHRVLGEPIHKHRKDIEAHMAK